MHKGLAKQMINPYYFTDRSLQVGLHITLDSRHMNHNNSKVLNQTFPNLELNYDMLIKS